MVPPARVLGTAPRRNAARDDRAEHLRVRRVRPHPLDDFHGRRPLVERPAAHSRARPPPARRRHRGRRLRCGARVPPADRHGAAAGVQRLLPRRRPDHGRPGALRRLLRPGPGDGPLERPQAAAVGRTAGLRPVHQQLLAAGDAGPARRGASRRRDRAADLRSPGAHPPRRMHGALRVRRRRAAGGRAGIPPRAAGPPRPAGTERHARRRYVLPHRAGRGRPRLRVELCRRPSLGAAAALVLGGRRAAGHVHDAATLAPAQRRAPSGLHAPDGGEPQRVPLAISALGRGGGPRPAVPAPRHRAGRPPHEGRRRKRSGRGPAHGQLPHHGRLRRRIDRHGRGVPPGGRLSGRDAAGPRALAPPQPPDCSLA